jgi:riboflavin biosynthesis pyrimidine reductase
VNAGKLILVEGGSRLLGDFYAEGILDEQFLTLAPQIAGRNIDDRRFRLVNQTLAFATKLHAFIQYKTCLERL